MKKSKSQKVCQSNEPVKQNSNNPNLKKPRNNINNDNFEYQNYEKEKIRKQRYYYLKNKIINNFYKDSKFYKIYEN